MVVVVEEESGGGSVGGTVRGSEEEIYVVVGPLLRNTSDGNVVVSKLFGPLLYRSNNYA